MFQTVWSKTEECYCDAAVRHHPRAPGARRPLLSYPPPPPPLSVGRAPPPCHHGHPLQLQEASRGCHGRRRGGDLRLDGIVVTLGCYRCAEPAPGAWRLEPGAGGIFANFSLLLTEEPDMVDLGTIAYMKKEDKAKAPLLTGSQDEDDEDVDIIHLEITLDAFCSPTCKGLSALSAAQTSTRAAAAATEKNHRPVMLNDEDLSKTS